MADMTKSYVHPQSGNFITPKCRMVWPSLFKPAQFRGPNQGEPKFQITLLVPKGSDLGALKAAVKEAALTKFSDPGKISGFRLPILNTADQERLSGHAEEFPHMLRARSLERPGIVGPDLKPEEDPSMVYGGRWCVCSLRAFPYDAMGNKGVSFGLNNVHLLDHDDPIATNRVRPESEFEPITVGNGEVASMSSEGGEGASADDLF